MSEQPPIKKLSMKEKIALKKKQKNGTAKIESFVPTAKPVQPVKPKEVQKPKVIRYSFAQIHELFQKAKISQNEYTFFLQKEISNCAMDESRRMELEDGGVNQYLLNKLIGEINLREKSISWGNLLISQARNMILDPKSLSEALDFVEFDQIDKIIQTYEESSCAFLDKQPFNSEEERDEKKEAVKKYVTMIQEELNNKLDEIEQQEYVHHDWNGNNYDNQDQYKKKKKKTKPTKPKGPQKEKVVKPKKVRPKINTKIEETIQIEELKLAQIEEVERQGERAKLHVYDESKEPLNIIFIGHVDCGKSTICGNILVKTGKVSELEIKRFESEAKEKDRESWYLAYIMDLNDEEREKGKTVEVGRATFETSKKRFTILDCPGHEKYLTNMLAGAAQADVAALVISAKPGEFESGFEKNGQTKEHAMLAKALGVQRLVIVVNKMDTVEWSKDRFDYIQTNLKTYLFENCGYEDKDIFWTIISGLYGTNMEKRIETETAPWFYGDSLFDTFNNLPKIIKTSRPFLRIPLLDKYKDQGNMVFGKVESGTVKSNMKCVVMPSQQEITIQKIYDNDDNPMLYAQAGENVKLQIKGCELEEIKRGFVICGQQFWVNVSQEFIAEIKVLELLPTQIFNEGFTLVMHLHTIMEEVTVKKIKSKVSQSGEIDENFRKRKIKKLKSKDTGVIVLRTKVPICLEKFEEFSELGRFTLRKDNNTIANGIIKKFKPFDTDLLEYNNYFTYNQN